MISCSKLKEWAYLITAILIMRCFILGSYIIPTGSMFPTFEIGDCNFTWKWWYGWSRYSVPFGYKYDYFSGRIMESMPKAGDIAIFRGRFDPEQNYVKRVIGLPGDMITMKDSVVHVNGVPCPLELVGDATFTDDKGSEYKGVEYTETLPNGVQHTIFKITPLEGNEGQAGPYLVPEGHLFMMGDNRDMSLDSRFLGSTVGYVKNDRLMGKVFMTYFSFNRRKPLIMMPFNIHWGRFPTFRQ